MKMSLLMFGGGDGVEDVEAVAGSPAYRNRQMALCGFCFEI